MLLRSSTRQRCKSVVNLSRRALTRSISSQKTREPLRILFCGSDDFSVVSLKAIHEEHEKNLESVASIDVVCRPGKRVGRGLKTIREGTSPATTEPLQSAKSVSAPIAKVARNLSLPVHEVDTFTGWTPPTPRGSPINLVIAVSFGRLVPPRILDGAKYGGLNIHPSMLPDFHGPAPMHHTLLNHCCRTGITLQTMHPEQFDQGSILDQTPFPGFEHGCSTTSELSSVMAPLGAEMLVRGIKNSIFVPPYELKGWERDGLKGLRRPAPKITPEDSHLDWQTWTAEEILRKQRIIGPLWNILKPPSVTGSRERRVIWSSGFSKVFPGPVSVHGDALGAPYPAVSTTQAEIAHINTCDGHVLQVARVKLDGEREKSSAAILRNSAVGKVLT